MAQLRLLSYMSPGFPHSLFRAIGHTVGASVDFDESRSGPTAGFDPFADGDADLGWICSTSYVALALPSVQPSVQLAGVAWVPDDPGSNGRPVYFGDVVTRPGSGIRSLADLEGRRVGCNDPVSLSGNYSLRFALNDMGHDPDSFCDLVYSGGHHRSLDLVLAGELDAAVVDSVVRIGRSRLDPEVGDLRLVERLGPFPVQPLVARSGLERSQIEWVRSAIFAAGVGLSAELRNASLLGFAEVGADHYVPVLEAMNRLDTSNR